MTRPISQLQRSPLAKHAARALIYTLTVLLALFFAVDLVRGFIDRPITTAIYAVIVLVVLWKWDHILRFIRWALRDNGRG